MLYVPDSGQRADIPSTWVSSPDVCVHSRLLHHRHKQEHGQCTEADSHSAVQWISRVLWSPKFHYCEDGTAFIHISERCTASIYRIEESCYLIVSLTRPTWSRGQYAPPKRRWTYFRLREDTSQRAAMFIHPLVRTTDPIFSKSFTRVRQCFSPETDQFSPHTLTLFPSDHFNINLPYASRSFKWSLHFRLCNKILHVGGPRFKSRVKPGYLDYFVVFLSPTI
jgi:hypothetical protein